VGKKSWTKTIPGKYFKKRQALKEEGHSRYRLRYQFGLGMGSIGDGGSARSTPKGTDGGERKKNA